MDEKQFQDDVCQKLKEAGWYIKTEIYDSTKKNRLDIVAYHSFFETWFCFELKVPNSIKDYTRCLRQMIRYRNAQFKYPTDIFCFITPRNMDIIVERFFWRWGFGVGNYESMKVRFVNGEAIATVNLLHPQNYYFTPKEQIMEIKRRANNAWNDKDEC